MRWVGYQQRWLRDRSRMRAVVKSRRIGFSEVSAWRRAVRALGFGWLLGLPATRKSQPVTVKPVAQNIISASERQSLEYLTKVKVHLEALSMAAWGRSAIVHANGHEIVLYDGTKLRAFAPNPRTIRGDGGDVTMDEIGAMPRAREVWTAAKPMSDPTLSDPHGFEVDFIGTPEGDQSFFYDIMHDEKYAHVSRHTVTIMQAVADGFPLRDTIESLRAEVGDDDAFNQEYLCMFLASAMRYIPAELWDACCVDAEQIPELPRDCSRFGGYDVGRRQDAAAYAELAHVGEKLWQVEPIDYRNNLEFEAQQAWIGSHLDGGLLRLGADKTGMGEAPVEWLVKNYGARVEPIHFTNPTKEMLATGLKLLLDRRKLHPRRDDIKLRTEILLLRRTTTEAGSIRFDATRKKGSHGDGAWALALAANASGLAVKSTAPLRPDALVPKDLPALSGEAASPLRRQPHQQPYITEDDGWTGTGPFRPTRRRAWE